MDETEDLLVGCIADLLKHFPSYRILAVVETAERAAVVEQRFGSAVKAVPPRSALTGHCFNSVVTEVKASAEVWDWAMDVLPTRLAPGAIMYRVGEATLADEYEDIAAREGAA